MIIDQSTSILRQLINQLNNYIPTLAIHSEMNKGDEFLKKQ